MVRIGVGAVGRCVRALTVVSVLVAAVTVGGLAMVAAHGDRVLVVASGSMAPAVPVGSAVLVSPVEPTAVTPGDVVTFHAVGEPERLTTHRVVSLRPLPDGLFLQTQGDANAVADPNFVSADSVLGVVRQQVPVLGYWLLFFQSRPGRLVVLALPLLLLLLGQARSLWLGSSSRAAPARFRHPGSVTVGLVGAVLVCAVAAGVTVARTTGAQFGDAQDVGGSLLRTRDFCGSASTYGSVVAADGPQIHLRLDETAGSVAVDSAGTAENGLYVGGVTLGASPGISCSATTAAAFDGSTGHVASDTAATAGPQTFSVEAWFRTATPQGLVAGFGSTPGSASQTVDRTVYVDDSGHVVFGVLDGDARTVVSPRSYTDGRWHHAVATLGPDGMLLYLDGSLVAADPTVTTATPSPGHWRVGWDSLVEWPGATGPSYFDGDLDEIAVYPTVLGAEQVSTHWASGRP